MDNYSDWEFLLDGDTQDFRQLASDPGSGRFNIYGGVDHWLDCPNDDFRLTSMYCESETDAEVVWQIGYELLSLFNGASALLRNNHRKATIFRLLHKERAVAHSAQRTAVGLLGVPPFAQLRLDEELKRVKKLSTRLQLLQLATENFDVYAILKYMDMPPNWVNYYKALEALEDFSNNESIDLQIPDSQRKAFTNTANNFSLSGFDSRHGFKELTKKNNTPGMNLEEAHRFISNFARKYLKMAYFHEKSAA